MESAAELAAPHLAVAAAAVAAAAAAASVTGVMPCPGASAWTMVTVSVVVLELPAELASVAVTGVLPLAALQWAPSGSAGSPSCSRRHGGTLTGHGKAVSSQQSWGTQADPSSAWQGQG